MNLSPDELPTETRFRTRSVKTVIIPFTIAATLAAGMYRAEASSKHHVGPPAEFGPGKLAADTAAWQSALDAAEDGDTIIASPGTYHCDHLDTKKTSDTTIRIKGKKGHQDDDDDDGHPIGTEIVFCGNDEGNAAMSGLMHPTSQQALPGVGSIGVGDTFGGVIALAANHEVVKRSVLVKSGTTRIGADDGRGSLVADDGASFVGSVDYLTGTVVLDETGGDAWSAGETCVLEYAEADPNSKYNLGFGANTQAMGLDPSGAPSGFQFFTNLEGTRFHVVMSNLTLWVAGDNTDDVDHYASTYNRAADNANIAANCVIRMGGMPFDKLDPSQYSTVAQLSLELRNVNIFGERYANGVVDNVNGVANTLKGVMVSGGLGFETSRPAPITATAGAENFAQDGGDTRIAYTDPTGSYTYPIAGYNGALRPNNGVLVMRQCNLAIVGAAAGVHAMAFLGASAPAQGDANWAYAFPNGSLDECEIDIRDCTFTDVGINQRGFGCAIVERATTAGSVRIDKCTFDRSGVIDSWGSRRCSLLNDYQSANSNQAVLYPVENSSFALTKCEFYMGPPKLGLVGPKSGTQPIFSGHQVTRHWFNRFGTFSETRNNIETLIEKNTFIEEEDGYVSVPVELFLVRVPFSDSIPIEGSTEVSKNAFVGDGNHAVITGGSKEIEMFKNDLSDWFSYEDPYDVNSPLVPQINLETSFGSPTEDSWIKCKRNRQAPVDQVLDSGVNNELKGCEAV